MNKKSSRKKRSKSSKVESCIYTIEILDWELPYSFSVNTNKEMIEGPFWEHMNLRLIGKYIYPDKLAGSAIESTLLGDRRLVSIFTNPEKYDQYEPRAVGKLTVRGEQREFLGSISFDVLNSISFLLQAEKIKFLVLSGLSLHYGSADIRSIDFSRDFIVEDWT